MRSPADVTELLLAWSEGSQAAHSRLMEVVYTELKQLANAHLRREFAHHSLSATGLVHETYLKLVDQRRVQWQNRSHFFGSAAQALRRILVDRARARQAAKRGGPPLRLETDERYAPYQPPPAVDVLALDEALSRLAALDARWCRLVELRFFAGLSVDETAAILNVSPGTVKRDWGLARAWLFRELKGDRASDA